MNDNNQNPQNSTSPQGFTPSTASFGGSISPATALGASPEMLNDLAVKKNEQEDMALNQLLGLNIPETITDSNQKNVYLAFISTLRNMYRWEMLSKENITKYFQTFLNLAPEKQSALSTEMEELFNTKLAENLIVEEYLQEENEVEEMENLLDQMEPIDQENLIYYIQNGQAMPPELLAKVKAEMEREDEGDQTVSITDEEAEAFASKNIAKVLARGGFSASTLTSKDIQGIVNQNNSPALRNIPVRPNLPAVKVPTRFTPPSNTDQSPASTPSQLPPQDVPAPTGLDFQQTQAITGYSGQSTGNTNPSENSNILPSGNQRTFPKPIGISHAPKGLDDLLKKP
jgi:hypothetical protein